MIPKGTDPLLSPVSKLPTSILMQMHAVTSSTFCVHNAFIFQWNESPDQKTVVLCGISRSLFLFLEYKNVKIVGGLISRKIDQTTICAHSLEHSSERNDTSFAGYCTNSRKDRSYLDLSRSRKLASSLLLTRSGLVGNLGAKKGVSVC